ncbi:sugar MFS transporter [Aestuariicella hydrocarbonica]|uniref:Sugar MFS transporter n=1 Tax=Pseudomaricurvus hydrocarbonicus TaxID=1470433 RepID=A0A9E5T3Q6_9GAMM|nr:sugar MFS transporter [Aestuariicella hydrocarbonica]NHO67337.1 sugar MFS transporter [Aestuariicella hydrocarbonica]
MASVTPGLTRTELSAQCNTSNHRFALSALTSLFFIWGFITCLNDILIPHLKSVFSLSYTQAMLIQFCFFGAYFVMSLPAGALVQRIGYKRGLVVGLLVAGVGCLMFYPAASQQVYFLFLAALFVLASGITLLQVSANPYVTALGPPETASSRLNLTQAFNALGTTVAPFFGAMLILSVAPDALVHNSELASEADAVKFPYMLLATTLFIFAGIFAVLKLPSFHSHKQPKTTTQSLKSSGSAWQYPHLVMGAVGIFVYVGAEVSIGSFLVSFLGEPHIAGLAEEQAAHYIAWYWGGAMVGRFIGALIMTRFEPGKVLALNACAAVLLVTTAALGSGTLAMYAILLVGLCNSIMFPTIFSLALHGLGKHTSQGSGVLCLAIVGGALIPLLQGVLADAMGLQPAFILPVICYLYIVFYGLRGSRFVVKNN